MDVAPDYKNILLFIESLKIKLGINDQYDNQCGYKAGCLEYSLYNQLMVANVKIAQCLSYGGYHAVYVPTEDDDSVKEYLRMRDDHKLVLKKIKQQMHFVYVMDTIMLRKKWTITHWKWLKKLELSALYREVLVEYMASYEEQIAKIERFDQRIEELASQERDAEKVKRLGCFLEIKTHTALSLIVETGDFARFAKGNIYAASVRE